MSTQSAAVRGWTYEEFARLPDDGNRYRYAHFGVPEYWVIDAEARTVEVYRNGEGGSHVPEVVRDRWSWKPMPDGPVLMLKLPGLLEGYDELQAQFACSEQRRANGETRVLVI